MSTPTPLQAFNDDGTANLENIVTLAQTDPVELATQIIQIDGVDCFANADLDFDDVPGFEVDDLEYHQEGDGNPMYSVIGFKLNGTLLSAVRISGTYSSWDSSDWDESDIKHVHLKRVVTEEYIAVDGSEDKLYIEVLNG